MNQEQLPRNLESFRQRGTPCIEEIIQAYLIGVRGGIEYSQKAGQQ